jgi:PAS domain S-box-containing protein
MDYLVAYFTQVSKSSYANIVLAKQSFDLESVKESLRKSEETLRYVLDSIPQSVFWKDLAGVYRGCNRAFAQTVGFSDPGDVIGRTDFDLSWPKTDALAYRADDANVISSKIAMKHIVEQVQASNGGRMWVDTTKLPMSHDDGNVYGVLGVYEDITARKDAEERIASLLAEKELILKEVHHRIKNNMSTMVGLLALQASRLADPSAVAALEDARRSMQSMGFLYDRLYNSEGFSELPVRTYLGSLVDEILGNFPGIGTVTVEKRIDEFVLDAGRLQPIGIILNELLTNVMKYAFGDGGGNIVVSAELKAGRVSIAVRDDGVGIPESIGIGRTAGFGLTLVGALAEQLRGVVRIERERGTAVVLEFDL